LALFTGRKLSSVLEIRGASKGKCMSKFLAGILTAIITILLFVIVVLINTFIVALLFFAAYKIIGLGFNVPNVEFWKFMLIGLVFGLLKQMIFPSTRKKS
jgi:energy-coupling factor transporter transmembrane protein EcfT